MAKEKPLTATLRFPDLETRERWEAAAAREGRTLSGFIKNSVAEYLATKEKRERSNKPR